MMMINYVSIVTVRAPKVPIDTAALFDSGYTEKNVSPIYEFLENCVLLNGHWTKLGPAQELSPEMSRLLLIGYVSAVEGYMRSLIRKLIICDPFTRDICAPLQLSFAAVLHHAPEALPDALLEETSFSTQKVIASALLKFVGLKQPSVGTRKLLDEFDLILQVRHCCTHRFGKLGAKNATALGLHAHGDLLEKPVVITKSAMASVADLAFTLAKSINNDVFGFVMERSATGKLPFQIVPGIGWTWHKSRDRARFKNYYAIFSSTCDATPSLCADDVYELFRNAHRNVGTTAGKRRSR